MLFYRFRKFFILNAKIKKSEALIPDCICLSDHTSKWNMDIYLAVDREIADIENTALSGKFYCKVYEGSFKDAGKWSVDFENIVKSKGFESRKQFMWYTTCPKCAKKYGKNFVAILSHLNDN